MSTNSTPTSGTLQKLFENFFKFLKNNYYYLAASSPMSSKIDSQAQKQSINVHDWQAEFIEILETT